MFLFQISKLPDDIQIVIGIVSGSFLAVAGIPYIRSLLKSKRNRKRGINDGLNPRPLSWLGWTILVGISLYSQIVAEGWAWSHSVLVMSVAWCWCIFVLTIFDGNIMRGDYIFLFLGLTCLGIYLITKNAWVTTVFAIVADLSIGFPTLRNAYTNPLSERSSAWVFGAIGYFLAVINATGFDAIYYMFPVYLCLYNGAMVYLTNRNVT